MSDISADSPQATKHLSKIIGLKTAYNSKKHQSDPVKFQVERTTRKLLLLSTKTINRNYTKRRFKNNQFLNQSNS